MSTAPIETKVAASSGAAGLVTAVFAVLHWLDPHLAQPPAYLVGLLTTLLVLAAGYLAPHTSRLPVVPVPALPAPVTVTPVTAAVGGQAS